MAGIDIISMLSAKSIQWDYAPGGIPEIVSSDVAASFGLKGGISPAADLYRGIKYYFQDELREQLEHGVLKALEAISEAEHWNIRVSTAIYAKIVKTALHESLSGRVCGTCNGRKQFKVNNKIIICDNCDSNGHRRMSNRSIAGKLGIDDTVYARTEWKNRYNMVVGWFDDLDQEISNALKNV